MGCMSDPKANQGYERIVASEEESDCSVLDTGQHTRSPSSTQNNSSGSSETTQPTKWRELLIFRGRGSPLSDSNR